MRDFLIDLNEKYQSYKFIIWLAIIIVVLFLIVVNSMSKNNNLQRGSGNRATTSTGVYISQAEQNELVVKTSKKSEDNLNSVKNELGNTRLSTTSYIKLFLELCNNQKTDSAYELLSDECKNVLFPEKEIFVEKYCNIYFPYAKSTSISKYGENNTYKIEFKDDIITTGGSSNNDMIDYITVLNNGKLNIASYVKKEQINKSSNNSYVKVNVLDRYVFFDREEYEIEVENFTTADMILDDINGSGTIYLLDEDGEKNSLDIVNYQEQDLRIQGNKKGKVKLRFSRSYNKQKKYKMFAFENIKIINYRYTDKNMINSDTTTENSQEIVYANKVTSYPNSIKLYVKL